MLFNSISFLIFFSVFYLLYWISPFRFRKHLLLLGGIFFYGFFSIPFLLHFLAVILLNYYLYTIVNKTKSKFFLTLTVILNVCNLAFFKYFYFLNTLLFDTTGLAFFKTVQTEFNIILPLSISFYTFQIIACVVDAYRDKITKNITIFEYFLFLLFFPVLIAGPILRTTDFFPNLSRTIPEKDQIYRGLYLLMSGLVKKVLIADPISVTISPIFANPSEFDAISLFCIGFCYSIQVFCDFSGLTDMARSLALFLGFEIPENFQAPYFATSGADLWRRWHISLSTWLRDYIYFPLGGSKVANFRIYLNLIITFTIGGIWHGADYTFVTWGFYWGVILAIERFLENSLGLSLTHKSNRILMGLKAFFVFTLFSISGLMFRSESGAKMVEHFRGIFLNRENSLVRSLQENGQDWIVHMSAVLGKSSISLSQIENLERVTYLFLGLLFFHWVQISKDTLAKFRKYDFVLAPILGILVIFMLATMSQDTGNFIYYKF